MTPNRLSSSTAGGTVAKVHDRSRYLFVVHHTLRRLYETRWPRRPAITASARTASRASARAALGAGGRPNRSASFGARQCDEKGRSRYSCCEIPATFGPRYIWGRASWLAIQAWCWHIAILSKIGCPKKFQRLEFAARGVARYVPAISAFMAAAVPFAFKTAGSNCSNFRNRGPLLVSSATR